MTPYALTAEQLLAAAMFTLFMDINRHTAVGQSSTLAVKELEMATQDVDLDRRNAARHFQDAARSLDNYAMRAEEGVDVSFELKAADQARHIADQLLPDQSAWPAGPGMAEVIDMATWRRKA